jgi:hypothetical protein
VTAGAAAPSGDDGDGLAAGYIGRWRPSSVSAQAAAFARQVVPLAAPGGRERAKNLLWAVARLADYAIPLGLEPVPEVLLHPSVIERFARCAPGLSGVARRTLRTNLRFIARRVVPQLLPADVPLPREHAKAPYSAAEIAGYLALADAQPAVTRQMRAGGLVCLGAGAGLIRADLRAVHGADVICRSGGVIVQVRGARPRVVPVLASYHDRLLAAARFAGAGLVCGGTGTAQHHHPADPVAVRRDRAAPAGYLPAACDLAGRGRGSAGPGHVHARRRDHLLPAARRPARRAGTGRGAGAGPATWRDPVSIPLARIEEIVDASGVAPQVEMLLPIGVRHRQLRVRTLLAGMMLTQADRRPAFLTEVHQALTGLPEPDQVRLGVLEDWTAGPHLLTYRQTERTFGLAAGALAKDVPDGLPSDTLAGICDDLLEASIPAEHKHASPAGGGLDRRGDLLPPPAARQPRLRRPRGLLGPPLRRAAPARTASCSSATTPPSAP